MTGAEVVAIAGAISGIMKLAGIIIEHIERSGADLPDEAKESIRLAHKEAQAATEALARMPEINKENEE